MILRSERDKPLQESARFVRGMDTPNEIAGRFWLVGVDFGPCTEQRHQFAVLLQNRGTLLGAGSLVRSSAWGRHLPATFSERSADADRVQV
jgi:hypothetical protein